MEMLDAIESPEFVQKKSAQWPVQKPGILGPFELIRKPPKQLGGKGEFWIFSIVSTTF